ncbi:hypothetical protein B0H63DRAFT_370180, partial [Podospora didyma]
LEDTSNKTGQYICLSHRWMQPETQLTSTVMANYQDRAADLAINGLPRLYRAVFFVAAKLGVSYVWIDSLCIVQDDVEDWKRESVKMGDHYSQAYCTIAA